MSNYDDVWKSTVEPTLAIPDHAVNRYRFHSGSKLPDNEIRIYFKTVVSKQWSFRVALSKQWGHEGFAIRTSEASNALWLILNPDRMTNHDFVLVTVYTNDQFGRRMNGEFFTDSDFKAGGPPDRSKGVNFQAPMIFRVTCAEKEMQEFDSEEKVLEYLGKLADEGFTASDFEVWKKVKTSITIGG